MYNFCLGMEQYETYRDKELYMQMSRSFRGNDQ